MSRRYNDPSESLSGVAVPIENSTLLDFWKWAYCDLCDDDVKGIFAEWVIVKLLKSKHPRRISWANSDLITDGGVRIEVKATAYWQSFKLLDEFGNPREVSSVIRPESKVVFGGLKAGDATGYQPTLQPSLKSDLYVFAFEKETDPDKWNAMDLTQWEFFLMEQSDITHGSISLASLRHKFDGSLDANELSGALTKRVGELEAQKCHQEGTI